MDLSHADWNRLLCAEPLEGRWFLSAPADVSTAAAADDTGTAEILVVEREEDEDEDGDRRIAESQLPSAVAEAFEVRFPGADITAAEVEEEDEGTQYGVTAEHDGGTIDVTLSPTGQIIETEEFISDAEIPQAVLERLRERFPGLDIDDIDEAAITTRGGSETYEVAFFDATGIEWEAELSYSPPAPVPEPPPTSGGGGEEPGEAPASRPPAQPAPQTIVPPALANGARSGAARDAERIALDAAARDAVPDDQSAHHVNRAASMETSRLADQREDTAAAAGRWTELVVGGQANRVAKALEALAAGRGAAVWLPQVAGVLGDVLTIDVSAVERGLDEVLREIDALTGGLTRRDAGTPAGTAAPADVAHRLAALAAVAAGMQLVLLRYSKKNKGGPVVVFNGARSSWGWVLGTATPARPTRNWFRQ